jgi:hypothetical protein
VLKNIPEKNQHVSIARALLNTEGYFRIPTLANPIRTFPFPQSHLTRNTPAYDASAYPGELMTGNDKNSYLSTDYGESGYKWVRKYKKDLDAMGIATTPSKAK